MKNNPETPYCLSIQSVLNEYSKYAIRLSESNELGIRHSANRVNTEGIKMSQQLKAILLAPEFNQFVRGLNSDILNARVVLARPHNISINQPTYKAAYELASMSMMLRNTCMMLEGTFATGTVSRRCYTFLKNLSSKVHNLCVKIMGFLNGNLATIMSHFVNSMSHEIDARGTKDGN